MDTRPPRRVLIVDYAPEIRKLFSRALTHTGLDVSVAADGIAGLSEAHRHAPDIVVADLSMPHMGGVELCGALRRDPLTRWNAPIPIVSGEGSEQTQAAIAAGCDAVLEKLSPTFLVTTILRLLASGPAVNQKAPLADEPSKPAYSRTEPNPCRSYVAVDGVLTLLTSMIRYFACPVCDYRWQVLVTDEQR